MSSRRTKRILKELKELEDSTKVLNESGIYFYYKEENIENIYAMMIGPEGTPYEKGFYFFKFKYPENYPMEPPKAKYMTQGNVFGIDGRSVPVRFNPNLYTDGKVCLSMLNTWSGPGWVPTNTICNVLVAIQALVLNEEPLRNEPGYECADRKDLKKYNDVIEYSNIKISVLEMLDKQPEDFEYFANIMNTQFLNNIVFYRAQILNNMDKKKIESPVYSLKINVDYESLLYDLEKKYEDFNIIYNISEIDLKSK
jgi:ubiquitin-protein ligase